MLPIYDLLSSEEVKQIHEASLRVLSETGYRMEHAGARQRLAEAGAKLDEGRQRVYFPPELVEKSVTALPSEFLCAGREPGFDRVMKAAQATPFLRTDAGPISFFNLLENRSRDLTLADVKNVCTLADALDHIDLVSALTPLDLPGPIYDVAVVKTLLEANRKHFWALVTASENLKFELEMLEAAAGGPEELKKRPLASGIVCIIDPLRFPADEIERLLLYGRYNLPVRIPITSIIGANAPFTLAGTLTQINAEFLGAATVVQILCPGLPLWYYPLIQMLDMKSGKALGDGPEVLLVYAACAQMARHYRVPSSLAHVSLGSVQSHQIMYHLGVYQFFGSLLGAAEQAGAGSVQDALGISLEAMVLCAESMNYSRRFAAGFEISEESLGAADIKAQAESGEFLSSRLTLKYLRREARFKPDLWDWRTMPEWLESPSTIVERAARLVEETLRRHQVEPLPDDRQKEVDKIYRAAQKHLLP